MVNFQSQLQEFNAHQEDYVGDVIFLKNKTNILNGIVLLILVSSLFLIFNQIHQTTI